MSNPTENLGNSQEKAPNQPKDTFETHRNQSAEVHSQFKQHQADNVEFLYQTEKTPPAQQQEVLEKAKQWQKNGDLDLLRSAGLSMDQIKQNPLESHIRLASMFLTRRPTPDQLEFSANFHDNEQALWNLDLADLLPPNILKIDILDSQGKLLYPDATRGFHDNRPGYFTSKNERASLQSGWVIRVKETQSSLALKDQRQGHQTYENAVKHELYLVDNSRKTKLKEEVYANAAKQGIEVIPDKNFFDQILTDLMKTVSPAFDKDFQNNGKVDFSKFLDKILTTILGVGITKSAASTPASAAPATPPAPGLFDQSKQEKLSATTEKFSSQIDRNWLLEHVARNEQQVEKFLVSVNFMGANMRVNKLIAPYLIEAQDRIKAANLNFSCHQGDCSCQNWRPIRGGTAQSMHSWGTAIDLNVRENPWQPHLRGNNHNGKMISNMPPEVVNIMKNVGFIWGGDWSGPADPMHFEMKANPYTSQNVLRSTAAKSAASQYLN